MGRAVVAAALLLGALAACGSGRPGAFHSATKTYSVYQVESVFSEHGLPLETAPSQPLAGVIALRNGRGSGTVGVVVQVAPRGSALYGFVWGTGMPPQRARNGNVYVSFPAADSDAVHAALAELR